MNSLKRSFTFQKDQDIQSLIKQAIVPTNRELDWNTCIKICTHINSKKGSSKKARIVIVKKLFNYEEPQTQYLAVNLLKEICFNCAIFEDELRNVILIDTLRDMWHSKLHQKVRNILGELLTALGLKYKDDLYMHYLLNLSNGVSYYHVPQLDIVNNDYASMNRNTSLLPVNSNPTTPSATTIPINQDPFNDPRNIVRAPALVGSSSTPTTRINPIQMLINIHSKGSSATNESLSRFEIDELLNQAEIMINLFKEALGGDNNDLLEDLNHQSKTLHHRLIQQVWLLDNDLLYKEACLDTARNIYFLISEYKKRNC